MIGFNRDIVECKELSSRICMYSVRDLIETLWNVKSTYVLIFLYPACGFNRDIVECKV